MTKDSKKEYKFSGDELVRQDVITREELDAAKAQEADSGTPWYKQLIQQRKITFQTLENVLRYEFHSKAARSAHHSLGDTLLEMGKINEEQLTKALAEQKRNGRLLGNILLESGYATRESIALALGKQYNMEYAPLEETSSDANALHAVPENLAVKNHLLPITLENDKLTVLITSPQHREHLKDVAVLIGKRIHALLTACEDFEEEIHLRYRELEEMEKAVKSQHATPKATEDTAPESSTAQPPAKKSLQLDATSDSAAAKNGAQPDRLRFENISRTASGASVVKIVTTILEGAVNAGATDIHIDPQDPESRVRYRVDGALHDIMSIPENLHHAIVSRIKIISDLDITETRHPQDGHISMTLGDRDFDVRVATLPTYLGERVVLRLLDQSAILSGIKDLGLSAGDEKKVKQIISQPYGMILVTGPTGSGKTTTLYAALNQKNAITESIVTLEDPVEYQLSGINQVQIDTDINVTFAKTLRAALRQDIDVLLVGEIRDPETAQIAVRAAMTGHLVFSTLHTNDAAEAISTLRNMNVQPFLISSALTAVIGQRLVRKNCDACKKGFKPSAAFLKAIGLPATVKKLYRGMGCQVCHFTGNSGRTGIFEVLEITPALRDRIAAGESTESIAKAAKYTSMASHCRAKVKAGLVNPEEYLRVIRL